MGENSLNGFALGRNNAVRFGEHTRPRVFRLAPSPVSAELAPSPVGAGLAPPPVGAGLAPATKQ
jgi:hypothetical protein